MKNFKTEQEKFWAGEFGDNYLERNQGEKLLASNLNFFTKALSRVTPLSNCIEFGANIGMNLKALILLMPALQVTGIELHEGAAKNYLKL